MEKSEKNRVLNDRNGNDATYSADYGPLRSIRQIYCNYIIEDVFNVDWPDQLNTAVPSLERL